METTSNVAAVVACEKAHEDEKRVVYAEMKKANAAKDKAETAAFHTTQKVKEQRDISDNLRENIAQLELKEKRLGIFYRRSRSFLHFHEDPEGLFADLDDETGFARFPVNTMAEQEILLARLDAALAVG